MAEEELVRENRARLKFSRRVGRALLDEGVEALAAAKARHDKLEELYHPYVDFSAVEQAADRVADELLQDC